MPPNDILRSLPPPGSLPPYFYESKELPAHDATYSKEHLVATGTFTVDRVADTLGVILALSLAGHRRLLGLYGAVLFSGPCGCGKSTLAAVAANECALRLERNCQLIRVNAHSLASAERGGSQKNVQSLFGAVAHIARNGEPLFLICDEIETLFTERSQVSAQNNPMDTVFGVNAALECFDAIASTCPGVILLATTNHLPLIDAAMLDRFDDVFCVGLPNAQGRLEILRRRVEGIRGTATTRSPSEADIWADCHTKALAATTEGYSIRKLRRLVVDAIVMKGGDLSITAKDLLLAAKQLASIERRIE